MGFQVLVGHFSTVYDLRFTYAMLEPWDLSENGCDQWHLPETLKKLMCGCCWQWRQSTWQWVLRQCDEDQQHCRKVRHEWYG